MTVKPAFIAAGGNESAHVGKENNMIRKFVMALVLSGIALTATACNTVKGAGRDIESVGDAADKAM